MPENVAKHQYPRTRLKRLIRHIEVRLGRNRCFFSECQPRDKKKDSQFEVTKVYALYEVDHWPKALAHYEWTQFVMANIERDDTMEQLGADIKLALPMLPSSGLPCYEEMMRREGQANMKVLSRSGQIQGIALGGKCRIYAINDPRRHELHDRPNAEHLQQHTLSTTPQTQERLLLGLDFMQIQEIARDHQRFKELCRCHKGLVGRLQRSIYRGLMSLAARRPNMHLKTWDEVVDMARDLMKTTFAAGMQTIRDEAKDVQHLSDPQDGFIEAHLKLLRTCYRHRFPAPATAPPQLQTEILRQHHLMAMSKQAIIMQKWVKEMKQRVELQTGERYRRERTQIFDFWTCDVEDYATFNARNAEEKTGLTAESLPLAARAPMHGSEDQQQGEGRAQDASPASPNAPTEQHQAKNRKQKLPQPGAQTVGQTRKKAKKSVHFQDLEMVHGEEQQPIEGEQAVNGPKGMPSNKRKQGQASLPANAFALTTTALARQGSFHAELADASQTHLLTPATRQERMEVETTVPRGLQKQVQPEASKHAQKPFQDPADPFQPMDQFHAQLQAAAQEPTELQTQVGTGKSISASAPGAAIEFTFKRNAPEQSKMQQQHHSHTEAPKSAVGSLKPWIYPPQVFQDEARGRPSKPARTNARTAVPSPVQEVLHPSFDTNSEKSPQPSVKVNAWAMAQANKGHDMVGHALEQMALQALDQMKPQAPVSEEAKEMDESQDLDGLSVEALLDNSLAVYVPQQNQPESEAPTQALPDSVQSHLVKEFHASGDASTEVQPSPKHFEPSLGSSVTPFAQKYLSPENAPPAPEGSNPQPGQEPKSTAEGQQPKTPPPPPPLLFPPTLSKCQNCMRKGTKCDGKRPCSFCKDGKEVCHDLDSEPEEGNGGGATKKKPASRGGMGWMKFTGMTGEAGEDGGQQQDTQASLQSTQQGPQEAADEHTCAGEQDHDHDHQAHVPSGPDPELGDDSDEDSETRSNIENEEPAPQSGSVVTQITKSPPAPTPDVDPTPKPPEQTPPTSNSAPKPTTKSHPQPDHKSTKPATTNSINGRPTRVRKMTTRAAEKEAAEAAEAAKRFLRSRGPGAGAATAGGKKET